MIHCMTNHNTTGNRYFITGTQKLTNLHRGHTRWNFVLFVLLLISIFPPVVAQTQPKFTDTQLAYEYYRNREFDKAAVVYRDLYETTRSQSYLTMYLNCLFELSEFETAEKVVNKEIKKNPSELSLLVELGYVYKKMGKDEDATRQFELALKKLPADVGQIQRLANGFRGKMENAYAEKTYLKGGQLTGNPSQFHLDLAYVYMGMRRYTEMANIYFDLLLENPGQLANVQNRLQSAVFGDVDDNVTDLLKVQLVRKIQENPASTILPDLLIWLYLQQKEFGKAFFQAKALDKRENSDGKRILELARMAATNNAQSDALEMYQYLMDKGRGNSVHQVAKREWLGIHYTWLTEGRNMTEAQIDSLVNRYRSLLISAGETYQTATAMKELSHILAFHKGKKEEAIDLLEKTIGLNGMSQATIAECKLELADIQVLSGEVWSAALTYGQVEKANENNPIGYEAKFRKARLAYFMGDFLWAKAQLDVLKASTTKFISNDSFDLSLLIESNTTEDTLETPMQMFARADLLAYQGLDSLALQTFDSILNLFPTHSLTDQVFFRQAGLFFRKGDYAQTAVLYQKIITLFPDEILGDNALFSLAELTENQLDDKEKAMQLYEELLTRYPGSLYTIEARKNFRKLRGDAIE
jgi:tetratricopeptide (TPR) repeat protein